MKKLLPIVGVFILLLVAFIIVSQSSDEGDGRGVKWKIPAVPEIARIEVDRPIPLMDEGRQSLVLAQAGDTWRLTEPLDTGVPKHFSKKLSSMFEKPILMDDLELPADDLEQYGLDEENRINVKLLVPNGDPVTFTMGLGFRIDGTKATRTYVLSPGGKVYRARTDAGIVFAQPLSLMREKSLFSVQPDDLNVIIVKSEQGEFRFVPDSSGGWEVDGDQLPFELEQPLFKNIERQLTNFRVRGFRRGGKAKWGLDEPDVTVIAGTIEGDKRIDVKAIEEDGRTVYLAVLGRSDDVVELMPTLGMAVTGDIDFWRDRLVREIGRGNIKRVELAGPDRVAIERVAENEWRQVRPFDAGVSPKELGKFLGNLERFAVIRYSDMSPEQAGLLPEDQPNRVVAVSNDDTRHVLLLGNKTERGAGYLAKWEDDDEVFVIDDYLYDRFHPGPNSLLME